MPRQARIDAPGALHHVIVRGIERRKIFKDNTDRLDFLMRLDKVLSDTHTRCFAWALIPNHFHLLLRSGNRSLATVMRRLLTGYAIGFNRRHRRSGQLFQNRYKSILCQEDNYLLELVRYIHLNPLRAGLVADLAKLDRYRFCGHSVIMGKQKNDWQDAAYVLKLFADQKSTARRRYKAHLAKGLAMGKRPDLTGGGLVRSSGGWAVIKSLRKANIHFKSDERILGDSDFVDEVLKSADEKLQRRYALEAEGWNLDKLAEKAGAICGLDPEQIFMPGKQPIRVKARSIFCYWAARQLGVTTTKLAGLLKISQPAVSICVRRGEQIVKKEGHDILDKRKIII
jgi:REP element-mobilizing transposase RayT